MTYYGNGKSDWTAGQVDQLRTLAATGLSASQIGAKMGLTKGAVVGKASRSGVKLQRIRGYAYPKGAKGTRKKPLQAKIKMHDGWTRPPKPAKPSTFDAGAPMVLPATERGELPVIFPPLPLVPIGFAELERDSCRWPITGTGAAMLYCGAAIAPDKLSFCPFHCRRAYRPRAA